MNQATQPAQHQEQTLRSNKPAPSAGNNASVVTLTAEAIVPHPRGQAIPLIASVAGGGKLTGTVTFFDGEKAMGTAPIDEDQAARFVVSSLEAGPHSFTASFSGDGAHNPSRSAPVEVTAV